MTLCPRRHFDRRQLLHGHQIRHVVHYAAEIIDPIGVGDVGVPGLPLAHLFGASVMKADLRHGVYDLFAVQLQSYAQYSVRARMLRTDVQEHEIRPVAARLHAPIFGPKAQRFLLRFLLLVGQLERPHFGGSRGMVLQQRMSYPRFRHQDSFHVRVALKTDPEHVPDFPFVPIRRGPKIRSRIDGRLILLESHFDAEILVPIKRQQVIHHREVACRLPLPVHPHTLVDGGEVVQHPVRLVDFVLQETESIVERSAGRSSRSGFRPR